MLIKLQTDLVYYGKFLSNNERPELWFNTMNL